MYGAGLNVYVDFSQNVACSRVLRLTPVILATRETEIRRMAGLKPARANSSYDPISKKPITRKGLVE
jgi:hypothetical protein